MSRLDVALCSLDGEFGDSRVAANIHVVGTGHDLGCRDGCSELGDFLWALVDEQEDQFDVRMILHDGIRNMLKKGRFPSARGGHDEPALTFSHGAHHIDDSSGVAFGRRFHADHLHRIDDGEFVKGWERPDFFGRETVDGLEFVDLLSASAPASDALELVSVFEAILPDEIRWNIHVLRMLHEVAARIAQESKAFAGDFDDAIEGTEFLGSRWRKLGTFAALAAVFGTAVRPVSTVVSFVAVTPISAIFAAAPPVTVASIISIISIASISASSIVSVIAKA